jgi:predicted permease
MTFLIRIRSLATNLFRKDRVEHDLDAEVSAYLGELIDEKIAAGMSPADARRAARLELGGVEQVKEQVREVRTGLFIERLWQDLRYGLRMLRKNPGFTTVALTTLALGIGANSAIFSVLDAVMLQTLPVRDPQQLLLVNWTAKDWPAVVEDLEGSNRKDPEGGGWITESVAYPVFEALRTRNTTLSEVFAFSANINVFNVQFEGQPHSAATESVSGNYFNGLGVQTVMGRPIIPSDDLATAEPVAVVSYKFWKGRLGGDESIIGKTIVINSLPLTIVGVAPPEFFGAQPGEDNDVWVTLRMFPRLVRALSFGGPAPPGGDAESAALAHWEQPSTWWLVVMGRIKPGVSETQVRAELDAIFNQSIDAMITSEKQQENRPTLKLAAGHKGLDELRRRFSEPLFVLMGAVGLVLLIACANVAGLLLARATARQKEIAVRLSLGARRLRLIQQLLTESVLLAVMGGLLGLLLSRWMSELLVALVGSGRQSITLQLGVNGRVLLFTAGVALVTGVLFGLAPAFSATRVSLTTALKEGGAGGLVGARRSRLAKGLVCLQVALSLVLLVGAGLFLRTLQKLESVSLGFERDNLLLFSVAPGLNGYKGATLAEYYRRVQERIAAIPGVKAVSFSAHGPVGDGSSSSSIKIPGVTTDKEKFDLHRHLVGPRYFDTLGLPTLTGRVLDERDDASGPKVAVVNETLARKAFGDDNPLGRMLRFGSDAKPRDFQIVGVVGDAKYHDLREPAPSTAYFSHLQALDVASFMTFQVRTAKDPESLVAAMRDEVSAVDSSIPVTRLDTLVGRIDKALYLERMFSRLTGSFGLLALMLVCVGLYGTMSYFVARRTNEIGIRMALGAKPAGVFRMVLGEGLTLAMAGVVIGLIGAVFGTRLIAGPLYGVPATDPLTFIVVALLLIAVGLLACYVPARRAMKVDPMVALRYE